MVLGHLFWIVPMIVQEIKNILPGSVRTFFCSDPGLVIDALESTLKVNPPDFNLTCCSWTNLPCLDDILNDIILALGSMALKLWPGWYGENHNPGVITIHEGVSGKWFEKAANLCRENLNPLPQGFSKQIQVQELSRSALPLDLIIVLSLHNKSVDQKNIFSFVKACQWIASISSAKVAVLIPPELSDLEEIEAISYGALRFYKLCRLNNEVVFQYSNKTHSVIWEREPGMDHGKKEPHPLPEEGVPHPLSCGELVIASIMAADPELSALFEFNRKVTTFHGRHYIVDLLWEQGKLIVEIDGYSFHGNRSSFASDRNRDYELMISSYLVLRIPHWEVMDDPDNAMKKIKDMVKFRKKEGLHGV